MPMQSMRNIESVGTSRWEATDGQRTAAQATTYTSRDIGRAPEGNANHADAIDAEHRKRRHEPVGGDRSSDG